MSSRRLLFIDEMAQRSGCTTSWLREQALAGTLPCLQVDHRLLFEPDDVQQVLVELARSRGKLEDIFVLVDNAADRLGVPRRWLARMVRSKAIPSVESVSRGWRETLVHVRSARTRLGDVLYQHPVKADDRRPARYHVGEALRSFEKSTEGGPNG